MRPYPEGVAWDEAWRQRQRADAAEAVMQAERRKSATRHAEFVLRWLLQIHDLQCTGDYTIRKIPPNIVGLCKSALAAWGIDETGGEA